MMIALPWPASSSQQRVDLVLGADVDASRRLVEDEDVAVLRTSHFAMTIFCWLPPERFCHELRDRRRPDAELGDVLAAGRLDAGIVRRSRAPSVRRGSDARTTFSRTLRLEQDTELLAVLREVADPDAARPRPGSRSTPRGRARGPRRRSFLSAPTIARATSVRPAPMSPANPRISPRRTSKLTSRRSRFVDSPSPTGPAPRDGASGAGRCSPSSSRPTISEMISLGSV